jgi:hypothetical protein
MGPTWSLLQRRATKRTSKSGKPDHDRSCAHVALVPSPPLLDHDMNTSFPDEELSNVLAQLGVSNDGFQSTSLSDQVTASATAGVWRVSAPESSARPWSVILKVIHHSSKGHRYWLSSPDIEHPMYWKREALVLTDPRLRSGGGHLRPPRVFGVHAGPLGEVRLWLEDAPGKPGLGWFLHDYELAARHLGQFQGAFLPPSALPEENWWSRDWVRAYVERRHDRFSSPLARDMLQHPLLKLAFSEDVSSRVARIWSSRHEMLDRLYRVPQTLCHHDFWTKNLFHEPTASGSAANTVAIDWAYAGIGALGSDVATLMSDAINDGFIPSDQIEVFSDGVFEAYRRGLADARANINVRTLRFAYGVTVSLKFLWVIPDLFAIASRTDPNQPFAANLEQLFTTRGRFARHLLALADEASSLYASVR